MSEDGKDKEYRAEYVRWIMSLTPAERAEVNKLKMGMPNMESDKVLSNSYGLDPSEMMQASVKSHLMDELETASEDEITQLGRLLGSILAWVAEAKSIVAMGQRQWVFLYVIRPDLIAGQTLDSFGGQNNVTRQAMDKMVTQFRDNFGVTGRNMRGMETRLKCQKSHLK